MRGGENGSFEEVLEKLVTETGAELRLNIKVSDLMRNMGAEQKETWTLKLEKHNGDQAETYKSLNKVNFAGPWDTNSFRVDNTTEKEDV